MVNKPIEFIVISPKNDIQEMNHVIHLLDSVELKLDTQIQAFVVAKSDQQVLACAGIDQNIIKCVAISPDYQGRNISLVLMEHVIKYMASQGHFHLFLYTKPQNRPFFKGCGFYPIVEVDDLVVLMENTPIGIRNYCQYLQTQRAELTSVKNNIGSIVMNANPFTNGHYYLIEQAAKQSDWLHVFVVQEEASMFSFVERFTLVKQGVSHLSNVSVHASSPYSISKATFPDYFLKDDAKVVTASTAIDLLIFRNYIAPALNITHRFIGTEPDCIITKDYNLSMKYWLQDNQASQAPVIDVIEIERKCVAHGVISASKVRALLHNKQYLHIRKYVPEHTWMFLKHKYILQNN